jgi:hypothetical protein
VIFDFLGEHQGCTHQPGNTLAKGIVKLLEVMGFRAFFVIAMWRSAGMTPL